jgi:hypothetical protein
MQLGWDAGKAELVATLQHAPEEGRVRGCVDGVRAVRSREAKRLPVGGEAEEKAGSKRSSEIDADWRTRWNERAPREEEEEGVGCMGRHSGQAMQSINSH